MKPVGREIGGWVDIKSVPAQVGKEGLPVQTSQTLTALNQLLKSPLVNGKVLANVSLSSGDNTVSHGLGRALQGWFPVRLRGSATLYDKQDSNSNPNATLVINASAQVKADLYVF